MINIIKEITIVKRNVFEEKAKDRYERYDLLFDKTNNELLDWSDDGDPQASYELAERYHFGEDVGENHIMALHYYRLSLAQVTGSMKALTRNLDVE